jgi:formate hydrogenlyase transcriptional activator
MQTSHNTNGHSSPGQPVEEVLRFARKLGMHSHPEQLLRALPAELSALVECRTAALIYQREGELDFHLAGGQDSSLSDDFSGSGWQQEIWSAASEQERPLIIPSLDEDLRFPDAGRLFRAYGNQSLCVLPLSTPLHRLGALCMGRRGRDAFFEHESSLLSLVGHYAALAINDRFNFDQSELVRAQLEQERTKLRLILDLKGQ